MNKISYLSKLIKRYKRKYKRPLIVIFYSPLHGVGKSTLADALKDKLKNEKLKIKRISSGDIFRYIAIQFNKDITTFVKNHKLELDLKIDKYLYNLLKSSKIYKKYDLIIVDSLIAPFIDIKNKIVIFVEVPLDILANRILKHPRKAEKKYTSIYKVKKDIILRSITDLKKFKKLYYYCKDPKLKKVYYLAMYPLRQRYDIYIKNTKEVNTIIKILINKLIKKLNRIIK